MKKLMIGLAIASALGLTACDDETISDVEKDNEQQVGNGQTGTPVASRIVFDPANGVLSVPNDLLFQGTTDGTLNFPVPDANDFSDPLVAANTLDGWSTHQPFVLDVDMADGISLDSVAVFNTNAITIFEAVMGGDLNHAECAQVPVSIACKGGDKLVLGEDYVVQADGSSLVVVPLKPLKPKTTYIMALTDKLLDSEGNPVLGSETYDLVGQDPSVAPITDPSLSGLQAILNSFETLTEQQGVPRDSITYTAAMTTQSVTDSLGVTKQLLAASLNPQTAMFPTPAVMVADAGFTAADALIAAGRLDPADPELVPLYKSAKVYGGQVTVPYYLKTPMTGELSETTSWSALCDSGAMLAFATDLPAEPQSPTDAACMSFGLRDLGIDTERNLTKFNPIPALQSLETLDVQMTVPDPVVANIVRAALGMPGQIAEPESGWPVVMLQHGITSRKEDMMALTGILAANGFATIAIDHPLHNSRGYDLDDDGVAEVEAAANPFYYINIANLVSGRDNFRQSAADAMALRMGINFLQGANIDSSEVFYVGHSLGALTGVNFLAMTNTPMDPMVDGLFNVKAASLASAAGGVPNFGMASPTFGPLIKYNLAISLSADFAEAAASVGGASASPDAMVAFWNAFEQNGMVTPEVAGAFAQWTFAAQAIVDSADMINYAGPLRANGTPLHLVEMVGNGMDVPADTVIPLEVATSPLSGSTPLIGLLGVPQVSQTTLSETPISGAVKFVAGDHGSLLDPTASAAATFEIQQQIAAYFLTKGTAIVVTDESVVLQ
ncbi:lipase [Thalassotalea sp. HSM 43]|uniref:VolA/Pla-1 family phospholipase n=1 Tax=Thalassotalea sp. HSM 43 TaxID=2552945 RepID=UPI0010819F35|nr:VolA/Pla-1 family phospholipase [Thalassotalea sp. HSM 43]QBY03216.1 lipase [Thalassotalea sp. HSM 43]